MIFVQLMVTLRTTNDLTRSCKHCLHQNIPSLPIIRHDPQPSPDLDMQTQTCAKQLRQSMLAAGGPNYETVLHDADTQMGPDSENIPSERCGGEARRANLKQRQGI